MSSNYDADGSVVNIGGDMMGGTIIYKPITAIITTK